MKAKIPKKMVQNFDDYGGNEDDDQKSKNTNEFEYKTIHSHCSKLVQLGCDLFINEGTISPFAVQFLIFHFKF